MRTVTIPLSEYTFLMDSKSTDESEIERLSNECKKKYGKSISIKDSNNRETISYFGLDDEADIIKELTDKLNASEKSREFIYATLTNQIRSRDEIISNGVSKKDNTPQWIKNIFN